ncbi:MAG TPA: hypothetical protein VFS60_10275 [Thermoanaerobaculia bacterium]|nr:hypothetical protein [Thermoanaerobaculia bacterium]
MDDEPQSGQDGEATLEGCFAPDGTDLTLIQWFLRRTPGERLQTAQSIVDLVALAPRIDEGDSLALLRALHDQGVKFVVVGGLAALLQGVPIRTLDIAVVYQADPANFERLSAALSRTGATYRDPAGRTIKPDVERLMTNGMNLMQTPASILDAMREIAPGWRFEDLVERSHLAEVSGMNLRVLDLAAVIESKEAADRPKDRAALFVLRNTLEMRRRQGLPT